MEAFGSKVFRTITIASTEQVWSALTATGRPLEHLCGLVAWSEWRVGSTVSFGSERYPGVGRIVGEVLAIEEGRRLSYSLGDEPGYAVSYLTWEIAPHTCGAVIQLTVDEPDTTPDELDECWRPVIRVLTANLDQQAASP